MDALRDLYLVYLDLRDQSQLNRCTPILVQCYDYVTPANRHGERSEGG
ncbi:MAG: hypothetical protein AB2814_06685 [Candidatus Sedimenticola endophacoides]